MNFRSQGRSIWENSFWAISYTAFSLGHVTDEMIQEYLAYHDNHPDYRDSDDEFRVE